MLMEYGTREKDEAYGKLRKMHIMLEKDGQLSLDKTFRDSFRMALTGGYVHPCFTYWSWLGLSS